MPYKPTDGMKVEAQRGLDWRKQYGRGGTEVGIARARDIVNDKNLSEDTVKRMYSFFSRHEVDKKAEGFSQGEDGYPSNGRIAWALWGGDAGFSWSRQIAERLKKEDRTMQDVDKSDTMSPDIEDETMTEEVREEVLIEAEEIAEVEEAEVDIRFDREKMKTRGMMFDNKIVDEEKRTVRIAVSSEEPVERSFGNEILDHNERSIDLSFARSGTMPLLLDHDPRQQIGVVEDVNLDGSARRLRATVRFGRNGLAKEVFDDVVDGIRSNISVGYHVNSMVEEGANSYRVDNWLPMEVSVVSIPADRTVGVGRAAEQPPAQPIVQSKTMETTMTDEVKVDVEAVRADAARAAAKDTAEMYRLAAKHNKREMADKAVADGRSLAEFRGELLEAIGNQPLDTQEIGLTKKEVRNFSLMKAIRAMANPTDRNAQAEAAFEFEASQEAAKRAGVDPQGLYMPMDVMRSWNQRDLNTSDDSAMVAEAYRGGDFIDVLRNASSVMQAGATMLTGLQGDVKIPKKTAASSAGWIATEGGASSESEPTFGQVTMSPKTIGAFTDITRLMMLHY
jgi:hypothetical protein